QYMATLHDRGNDQPRLIDVKGAVEVLLSKCDAALDDAGQPVALDHGFVLDQLEEMAAQGLRVLAFAKGQMSSDAKSIEHCDISGLTFLGLQGMIDPPRPEAIQAIRACQTAGIRVKMITGDHPVTARAIAEKLGLDGAAAS